MGICLDKKRCQENDAIFANATQCDGLDIIGEWNFEEDGNEDLDDKITFNSDCSYRRGLCDLEGTLSLTTYSATSIQITIKDFDETNETNDCDHYVIGDSITCNISLQNDNEKLTVSSCAGATGANPNNNVIEVSNDSNEFYTIDQ